MIGNDVLTTCLDLNILKKYIKKIYSILNTQINVFFFSMSKNANLNHDETKLL